eukprot:TRINITY_DN13169_c1_g1_i3.p1 TRINITY_DN13169_c1_g1~~TRINITY_DN13169_c1_g1_i3.p1  ORF type:complete len:778 (+),score=177.88 TRINITY_DN13169_c1_g1_i3:305-2335(+)
MPKPKKPPPPAAPTKMAGNEGLQMVQGHPWVTSLRSVAEWQWDLPAPGALDEHLVFLIMGASNIVGAAQEGPNIIKSPLPGPAWTCDPTGRVKKRCMEPLHPNDGVGHGIGPCRAFARRLLRNIPKIFDGGAGVFLCPCGVAHGDMTLKAWAPDGVLYSVAVARARTCAQAVGGRIAGVLWHQGEADACTAEDSAAYDERIQSLVKSLRVDLGDPRLPIIVGEIGESFLCSQSSMPDACKHARTVNRALRRLNDIPFTKCIPAPTTCHEDQLTFDSVGMEELGTRAAEEWEKLWRESSQGERRLGPDGVARTKEAWIKAHDGKLAGKVPWAAAPTYYKDDDGPGPYAIPSATPDAAPSTNRGLFPGAEVEAFGLQGAKELNGLFGTVHEIRADGRVVVVFEGIGNKALKADNLRPVHGEAAETAEEDDGTQWLPPHLQKDDTVVAHGLQGAKELNGLKGVIVRGRPDGRVIVSFVVHGEKALKPDNLKLMPMSGPVRPGAGPISGPVRPPAGPLPFEAEPGGPEPPKGLRYGPGCEVEVSRSNGRWTKGTVKKLKQKDGKWQFVIRLADEPDMYKYIDLDRAGERMRKPFFTARFNTDEEGEDAAAAPKEDKRNGDKKPEKRQREGDKGAAAEGSGSKRQREADSKPPAGDGGDSWRTRRRGAEGGSGKRRAEGSP